MNLNQVHITFDIQHWLKRLWLKMRKNMQLH